jgi:hypothetical protein
MLGGVSKLNRAARRRFAGMRSYNPYNCKDCTNARDLRDLAQINAARGGKVAWLLVRVAALLCQFSMMMIAAISIVNAKNNAFYGRIDRITLLSMQERFE